jgi:hypothetical protein
LSRHTPRCVLLTSSRHRPVSPRCGSARWVGRSLARNLTSKTGKSMKATELATPRRVVGVTVRRERRWTLAGVTPARRVTVFVTRTKRPMVTSWNNAQGNCRRPLSRFNKINGRHDWTRTSDLYRVKVRLSTPLNNFRERRRSANPSKYAQDESIAGWNHGPEITCHRRAWSTCHRYRSTM